MNQRPDLLSAATIIRSLQHYTGEVCRSLILAARRWQRDDASSMAAGVAYYLALSVFPMWLLLSSGIGMVLKFTKLGKDAESQIFALLAEHCSPSLEAQVRSLVIELENQSVVSGPLGLLTASMTAIAVFYQFERGFDKIWRIPAPASLGFVGTVKRVITQRLTAFMLLAGLGLSIVAILAANVAIGALRQWMAYFHLPGTVMITIVDAATTMLLNAIVFGMLYRWLPKRPVLWRDAFRGGLLVSLIWEIGRQLLGVFLIRMSYTSAYGAPGSLIAMLLWFYWGVTMLFFGAEYVQVLGLRHAQPLKMFRPENSVNYTPEPAAVRRAQPVRRRAA